MDAVDRYLSFKWNPMPGLSRLTLGAPGFLHGVTIAFAADFHIRECTSDDYIKDICELISSNKPDILLLGGDYGESRHDALRLLRALGRIKPRLGAFAVAGNNDAEAFSRDYSGINRLGIEMLVNRAADILINGKTLTVGGVDEVKYGAPDACGLFGNGSDYSILLAHYPELPENRDRLPDIALSGHTHGGQIDFFGITPFSLGFERKYRKRARGFCDIGGARFFITPGIGVSRMPIRLGAAPMVHLITFETV